MSIPFILKSDSIELCRLLKAVNLVSSGGEGKQVIAEGLVSVDHLIESRKRCKIRAGQQVTFNQETIEIIAAD
jgi:ribosome-associated protein